MAGVFGKDPNMKRSGGQEELERISQERKRKLASAAAQFLQKKSALKPSAGEPASTADTAIVAPQQ